MTSRHHAPIRQAERLRRLVLAARDRRQPTAHDLRHIGRSEQRDADQRAQKLVRRQALRNEQRQHHARHEQHRDQRHAADEFDESHREKSYRRHIGAAGERQQNTERQGHHDAHGRDYDCDQDAAPERGRDVDQAKARRPAQKDIGHDRQHDEEIDGGEVAARRRQPSQPGDAECQRQEEHVHTPALSERIEAVNEIGKPHTDKSPTGAGLRVRRRSQASLAVASRPHRIEQEKSQQRRRRPGDEKNAEQRQRDIAGRRK